MYIYIYIYIYIYRYREIETRMYPKCMHLGLISGPHPADHKRSNNSLRRAGVHEHSPRTWSLVSTNSWIVKPSHFLPEGVPNGGIRTIWPCYGHNFATNKKNEVHRVVCRSFLVQIVSIFCVTSLCTSELQDLVTSCTHLNFKT